MLEINRSSNNNNLMVKLINLKTCFIQSHFTEFHLINLFSSKSSLFVERMTENNNSNSLNDQITQQQQKTLKIFVAQHV